MTNKNNSVNGKNNFPLPFFTVILKWYAAFCIWRFKPPIEKSDTVASIQSSDFSLFLMAGVTGPYNTLYGERLVSV